MTPPRGLKLRAEDEEDLQVLGACLQDAIVPVADMIWLRNDRRFAMVVNRFMWEVPPEAAPDDERKAGADGQVFSRIHGILSIHAVKNVKLRGIDQRRRDQVLSLLMISAGDGTIHLEFAEGGTIRLEVEKIACYLDDVGSAWPTRWRPDHLETPSGD